MGHNRVILVGNLVEAPVSKEYQPGKTLSEMKLAVNNPRAGKDKNDALFIKSTAFAGLGDICAKHLKKGSSILVEARLHINQYTDKNNNKRQSPELVLDNMTMLGEGSNAGQNTAILVGNLVADPETTTVGAKSTSKTRFRIAINNPRRKDAPAEYVDIVAFGPTADQAAKVLKKGMGVSVVGRLAARTFDKKDGGKGDAIEVVIESFQRVGGKKATTSNGAAPTSNLGEDEEIPF